MKSTLLANQCIVRIGRHAVLFHINLSGKSVFTVVPDAQATVFADPNAADQMAREHGLSWGQFTIEAKEETNES